MYETIIFSRNFAVLKNAKELGYMFCSLITVREQTIFIIIMYWLPLLNFFCLQPWIR
jgi:hypothetical protein